MKSHIIWSTVFIGIIMVSAEETKKDKRSLFDIGYEHGWNKHTTYDLKEIKVPILAPYPVHLEKKVPVPYPVKVPIHVDHPVPYPVIKPYPVHVVKNVPYPVIKKIPYPVKVPYKVSYPVKVPVYIEKPYPVPVIKKVPIHISQPYLVEKEIPYFVKEHDHEHGHGWD